MDPKKEQPGFVPQESPPTVPDSLVTKHELPPTAEQPAQTPSQTVGAEIQPGTPPAPSQDGQLPPPLPTSEAAPVESPEEEEPKRTIEVQIEPSINADDMGAARDLTDRLNAAKSPENPSKAA